ncbi:MAG: site-2 protease family protein [Thermoflexales bacterium]|nr:site-2 protease family protein [Thermoflexales bacterium]
MGGPLVSLLAALGEGDWLRALADLIVLALLLGVAFPLHELAHALAARYLGDHTAEYEGRITLNPLVHLDPIGALMLALAGFGWAKPVPVNPYRLRPEPRIGGAIVALAGPLMNLALAVGFAVVFQVAGVLRTTTPVGALPLLLQMVGTTGVVLNIFLALFNLVPVPPLDGSRLLAALFPEASEFLLYRLGQYGFLIIILLSVSGVLGMVIGPPARFLINILLG